jgi:hypothetical protein
MRADGYAFIIETASTLVNCNAFIIETASTLVLESTQNQ